MFATLLDLYELTMAESYLAYKPGAWATFDLFVRQLPRGRSYLTACGLEDIVEYLKGLRFTAAEAAYLKSLKMFSPRFLDTLRALRFTGDVWAIPEGTVCFPYEPLIRVTAPIIEAQLVEGVLLNTINLQTMIASKASRIVHAAAGKGVFDFSLRRTHGAEASVKVARAAYIAGCAGTSNVLAGWKYGIPVAGTMAHSFVMSFKEELDSFLAYASVFPGKTILLVDTYDTRKGIEHAITAGHFLAQRGYRLQGIRLDSGDLRSLSRYARERLDEAGLHYVKIVASGDLDEYRISRLISRGGCVDLFGVGTNMGASIDAPVLDVIYKTCEVTDRSGAFVPAMKLSAQKVTYPGRKQVYRVKGSNGRCVRDVLCLEGEKPRGRPLLVPVMKRGVQVYRCPGIEQVRRHAESSLAEFPDAIRGLAARYQYPVTPSRRLLALRASLLRRRGREQDKG